MGRRKKDDITGIESEDTTETETQTQTTSEDTIVTDDNTVEENTPDTSPVQTVSDDTGSEITEDDDTQKDTKRRHQEALDAGFENAEQHETFKKQQQVARQQGMPEPQGPTAPHPSASHKGITAEQKKAIAKQAQQEHTT